jgi:hypothetical protein
MTRSQLIFSGALAAALASASFAGCGGKVVIDQGEGGGGTSNSSTTTVGTSVSATGGGTDVAEGCKTICGVIVNAGCGSPSCAGECVQTHAEAGMCADEFEAMLACYLQNTDAFSQCKEPPACSELENAFNNCEQQGGPGDCSPQECGVDNGGGCSCTVACSNTKFTSDCKTAPDGNQFCVCGIDGNQIGSCDGPNICDIFEGCCGAILFGQGSSGGGG